MIDWADLAPACKGGPLLDPLTVDVGDEQTIYGGVIPHPDVEAVRRQMTAPVRAAIEAALLSEEADYLSG